jgi:hypothetical protein
MRSQKLDQETRLRQEAEKRVHELEEELFKRMQRKHYIKGDPQKRQQRLSRQKSKSS